MPAQRRIAAGNNFSFLGFLDAYGLLVGGDISAPANGSASGMLRILGIQQAPTVIPPPDTVQVPGDDDIMGEFDFNPTATRAYNATFAVNDEAMATRLLGVNVETFAGIRSYEDDINDVPDRQCVVIHQSRAKSQDAGTKGVPGYEGYVIHSASVRYIGRSQLNIREPAVYTVRITPQLVTKDFRGITIASGGGTEASRRKALSMTNPVHVVAFTGDETAMTIPLDYTPISTALTTIFVETATGSGSMDAGTAPASVSVANKTATAAGTVAAGRHGLVIYQLAP